MQQECLLPKWLQRGTPTQHLLHAVRLRYGGVVSHRGRVWPLSQSEDADHAHQDQLQETSWYVSVCGKCWCTYLPPQVQLHLLEVVYPIVGCLGIDIGASLSLVWRVTNEHASEK